MVTPIRTPLKCFSNSEVVNLELRIASLSSVYLLLTNPHPTSCRHLLQMLHAVMVPLETSNSGLRCCQVPGADIRANSRHLLHSTCDYPAYLEEVCADMAVLLYTGFLHAAFGSTNVYRPHPGLNPRTTCEFRVLSIRNRVDTNAIYMAPNNHPHPSVL